jgi:hypothetical protein
MKIPDEMLSAFVNGELDGAERQRVELAIARDRRVAQRVAKQRANRSRPRTALDEALRPSPDLRRDPARRLYPGSAQIIDLAQVRITREHTPRRRRPPIGPRVLIMASLAIGGATGALLAWLGAADTLTHFQDGKLLARGALSRALNEQIVGETPTAGKVRVTSTYRTREGTYCRAFMVSGPQTLAGMACRSQGNWQVQTLLTNAASPALLLELDRNVAPMPIPVATEAQLRARDWR